MSFITQLYIIELDVQHFYYIIGRLVGVQDLIFADMHRYQITVYPHVRFQRKISEEVAMPSY